MQKPTPFLDFRYWRACQSLSIYDKSEAADIANEDILKRPGKLL